MASKHPGFKAVARGIAGKEGYLKKKCFRYPGCQQPRLESSS
jgi:hypothetical protein